MFAGVLRFRGRILFFRFKYGMEDFDWATYSCQRLNTCSEISDLSALRGMALVHCLGNIFWGVFGRSPLLVSTLFDVHKHSFIVTSTVAVTLAVASI